MCFLLFIFCLMNTVQRYIKYFLFPNFFRIFFLKIPFLLLWVLLHHLFLYLLQELLKVSYLFLVGIFSRLFYNIFFFFMLGVKLVTLQPKQHPQCCASLLGHWHHIKKSESIYFRNCWIRTNVSKLSVLHLNHSIKFRKITLLLDSL